MTSKPRCAHFRVLFRVFPVCFQATRGLGEFDVHNLQIVVAGCGIQGVQGLHIAMFVEGSDDLVVGRKTSLASLCVLESKKNRTKSKLSSSSSPTSSSFTSIFLNVLIFFFSLFGNGNVNFLCRCHMGFWIFGKRVGKFGSIFEFKPIKQSRT